MMKALNQNDLHEDALAIYDSSTNNDILHLFAIESCIKTKQIEKGKAIYQHIMQNRKNLKNVSIKLRNVLIDFYLSFGDLKSAQNIFESIESNQKCIKTVNAMMESLVDR